MRTPSTITIYITPVNRTAVMYNLAKAGELLQRDGDHLEFSATTEVEGMHVPATVTFKLVDRVPKPATSSIRDAIIAGFIIVACGCLIAIAILSPKHRDRRPDPPPVEQVP